MAQLVHVSFVVIECFVAAVYMYRFFGSSGIDWRTYLIEIANSDMLVEEGQETILVSDTKCKLLMELWPHFSTRNLNSTNS